MPRELKAYCGVQFVLAVAFQVCTIGLAPTRADLLCVIPVLAFLIVSMYSLSRLMEGDHLDMRLVFLKRHKQQTDPSLRSSADEFSDPKSLHPSHPFRTGHERAETQARWVGLWQLEYARLSIAAAVSVIYFLNAASQSWLNLGVAMSFVCALVALVSLFWCCLSVRSACEVAWKPYLKH